MPNSSGPRAKETKIDFYLPLCCLPLPPLYGEGNASVLYLTEFILHTCSKPVNYSTRGAQTHTPVPPGRWCQARRRCRRRRRWVVRIPPRGQPHRRRRGRSLTRRRSLRPGWPGRNIRVVCVRRENGGMSTTEMVAGRRRTIARNIGLCCGVGKRRDRTLYWLRNRLQKTRLGFYLQKNKKKGKPNNPTKPTGCLAHCQDYLQPPTSKARGKTTESDTTMQTIQIHMSYPAGHRCLGGLVGRRRP